MTLSSGRSFDLAEQLGREIVVGRFKQSAFPTEGDLIEQFDVSRTVVREAVKMLAAKGLVHGGSGQGMFVSPEGAWNLFDRDVLRWLQSRRKHSLAALHLAEVRWGIEPEAAALAALRSASARRGEIQRASAALSKAGVKTERLARAIALHGLILEASANPVFIGARPLVAAGLTMDARFARSAGAEAFDPLPYDRLSTAIAAGDPNGARLAMRALLEDSIALHETVALARGRPRTIATPIKITSPGREPGAVVQSSNRRPHPCRAGARTL